MKRIEDRKLVNVPMTFLVSAILSSLLAILFSLLFSFLIISEVLPENYTNLAAPVSCFLASAVSAYFSSKTLGRAMLTSLIQAIVNIALAYVAGTVIFMRFVPQNLNLFTFLAFVFGAVIGGLLTAVIRPRRHKIK